MRSGKKVQNIIAEHLHIITPPFYIQEPLSQCTDYLLLFLDCYKLTKMQSNMY